MTAVTSRRFRTSSPAGSLEATFPKLPRDWQSGISGDPCDTLVSAIQPRLFFLPERELRYKTNNILILAKENILIID